MNLLPVLEPLPGSRAKRRKLSENLRSCFEKADTNRIISAFLLAWNNFEEVNISPVIINRGQHRESKLANRINLEIWRFFALRTPDWFVVDGFEPGVWPITHFIKFFNYWVARRAGYQKLAPPKNFEEAFSTFENNEEMIADVFAHPRKWMKAYLDEAFEKSYLLNFNTMIVSPGVEFIGNRNWVHSISQNRERIFAEQFRITKGTVGNWLSISATETDIRRLHSWIQKESMSDRFVELIFAPIQFQRMIDLDGFVTAAINNSDLVYFGAGLHCSGTILKALWWHHPFRINYRENDNSLTYSENTEEDDYLAGFDR